MYTLFNWIGLQKQSSKVQSQFRPRAMDEGRHSTFYGMTI